MKYPVSDLGARLHNGKFTDGIPGEGVDASIDKARDMNAVYDELTALIIDGNQVPSESTLTQVRDAVRWLIAQAIATRAAASHGHNWSQLSGVPTAFPPAAHSQDWNTITGKPASYPPSEHSHSYVDSAGNANSVGGFTAAQLWRTDQAQQSFQDNGYQRLPSGLLIQWGYANFNANPANPMAFNFPMSFTFVCYQVLLTPAENASEVSVGAVVSVSPGNFTIRRTSGNEYIGYRYIAIGV